MSDPTTTNIQERKKKNASAQAAFRARRQKYIDTLESTVVGLEGIVLELQNNLRVAKANTIQARLEATHWRDLLAKAGYAKESLALGYDRSQIPMHPTRATPSYSGGNDNVGDMSYSSQYFLPSYPLRMPEMLTYSPSIESPSNSIESPDVGSSEHYSVFAAQDGALGTASTLDHALENAPYAFRASATPPPPAHPMPLQFVLTGGTDVKDGYEPGLDYPRSPHVWTGHSDSTGDYATGSSGSSHMQHTFHPVSTPLPTRSTRRSGKSPCTTSRSPSPCESPLRDTVAVIKASAFGSLRKTKTGSKRSSDGVRIAMDAFQARGIGMDAVDSFVEDNSRRKKARLDGHDGYPLI